MARRSFQPPEPNSLSTLIMTLTALSGEFPAAQVSRLSKTDAYRDKVVKSLKERGLLRAYARDGLRGLRLTAKGKRWLLANWPDRFEPLFTGDTMTNTPKYSVPHRLRFHRMGEVLTTMHNAGISSFPWEKPAVFQPMPPPADAYISCPAYYSSREVKEIGPQAAKIRSSRSTGILLTDGGIFLVYNTGATQMKWEYKAEIRLKALLQIELGQRRLPRQYLSAAQSGIVFGRDMDQIISMMDMGGKADHNYFVLDGSLEHFYYLTNDHYGEVILNLLCDPDLKEALDTILSENLYASRPGWLVENDAIDENNNPVLFAYNCDMPRIRRFDTALELHELEGTLICFDFQEKMLRQICGQRVAIQSIDFGAFERSVIHNS